MRSTLVKLVLGCGLAAAFAAPTMACEFYKQTVKTDQTVAEPAGPRFRSARDDRCAADRRIPTHGANRLELKPLCSPRSLNCA